jgi:hypothetical protein
MDGDVHVIPNGDLREHEASSKCWCKPSPDDDCDRVWVHHALDERESYEEGRALQ